MSLHYKRLLKEETETYSSSKTGKKKNKLNCMIDNDDDCVTTNELIDRIDTDLKHLNQQKKILQNAKEGKLLRYKLTFNEKTKTNNKNQKEHLITCNSRCHISCGHFCNVLKKIVESKNIKVTDSCTQIGSSLKNLNTKINCRGSPCKEMHLHKNSHFGHNMSSDLSLLNAKIKINKNRSSVRKVSSKTQTSVTKTHSKKISGQKQKIFVSENPFFESHQLSAGLESKTCGRHNFLTKLEGRSQAPPETSYESHTYQNINNNDLREVEAKSMLATKSPRNEKQTDKTLILSPRSPKADEKSLRRTESSIERHAKLSREILEHAKQRAALQINELKSHKKKHADKVYNRSLHSQNGILPRDLKTSKAYRDLNHLKKKVNVKHDGSILLYDKKEQKKDDDETRKSEVNNLTETSRSSKSYNVNTIKPSKAIDDNTYVCPDNSEENDYLILPYVGNTSENSDIFDISLKPESYFDEDISSQKSSKPSRSIGNERKTKTCESYPEPQFKKGFSQNSVSQKIYREKNELQRSDKSEYMPDNLECTWESHANRKGPLGIKFYMSHNNQIKIPTDCRSHNYYLKDQPVQRFGKISSQKTSDMKLLSRKDISNLLPSDQHSLKDDNPAKLESQMREVMPSKESMVRKQITNGTYPNQSSENRFSTQSFLNKDNSAFEIKPENPDLKNTLLYSKTKNTTDPKYSVSTLQNVQLRKSYELGDTRSNKTAVQTSKVKKKEEFMENLQNKTLKIPPLVLLTATELGAISKRSVSLHSSTETSEVTIPRTIETTVKDDAFQEDSIQSDTILKQENFETVASPKEFSSNLSRTPQTKSTHLDHDMKEKVLEQKRHKSVQNYDLLSKSSSFKSGTVSKNYSYQDKPRLRESKNEVQDKEFLPLKLEKHLDLITPIVSQKYEPIQNPNVSVLGAISKTQSIFLKPTRNESKINASTEEEMSLEFEPEKSFQKKASQDNPSDTRTSQSICTFNEHELGASSSSNENELILKSMKNVNSFPITVIPEENEEISKKALQKMYTSTKNILPTFQPERTLNEMNSNPNPIVSLKSGSNHLDVHEEVLPTSFPSILISDLDSMARFNRFKNGKDFDVKTKLLNSLSINSVSSLAPCKKYQSLSQKSSRSEPRMSFSPGGKSLQESEMDTPKANPLDEKNKPISKDAGGKALDTPGFGAFSSKLKDIELGAIPKLSTNENRSSFSLFDLPKKFKAPEFPQKSAQNYNELHISTESMSSKERTLEVDGISQSPNITSLLNSLPKINKSSASQYLEFFWNDNDKVKNSFRTSPLKLEQDTNLSRSSKSSYDLNNHGSVKVPKGIKSSIVFNSCKLEGSDRCLDDSSQSKFCFISDQNLKIEPTDLNMPITSSRLKEERPPITFKLNQSNNQIENKLDENFRQNSLLSLDNVKNEKNSFLSDIFDKNIVIEGVSRDVSDLIQHLQNRVKDCDENVKNQSKKLEKLKENCKKAEDEEKKPTNLKELTARLLENTSNDEQMETLNKEDTFENDGKEECHCIFCEKDQSTSDFSEEIPSFHGCECMKENYYEIMRIAYDK